MGVDIRDISTESIESLPDHLRSRGFAVTVTIGPNPAPLGGTLTKVECCRGHDVQFIEWGSLEAKPGIRRIAIRNQGGWLWWVRRRRFQLQADVTSAIEELGGYWPYAD
jgi:hypothetical protein